jgi:hypothetical protein
VDVYVTATDAAGNESTATVITPIDDIPPAAPDAGLINASDATNVVAGLAGAVEASSTVTVYSDAALTTSIGSVAALADGSFSVATTGLTAGVDVYVTATDASGNESAATVITPIDDITPAAPNAGLITAYGATNVVTGSSGAVEASSTVTVYSDAALTTPIGSAAASIYGSFSVTTTVLTAGVDVYVTATDAAGNESAATVITPIADFPPLPPDATLITASDATDVVTGLAGAVEASSTVTVYRNAALTTIIGVAAALADGSFSVTTTGLTAGVLVYVTATDAASNESAATVIDPEDESPPAAPDAGLIIASDATDVVTGSAGAVEGSSTVTVYSDAALTTSIGFAAALADGSFSVTTTGLTAGVDVYVTATDAALNQSAATVITPIIEILPPTNVSAGDVPNDNGGWIYINYTLSLNDPFHSAAVEPAINYYVVGRSTTPPPEPPGGYVYQVVAFINLYDPEAGDDASVVLEVPATNDLYNYRIAAVYNPSAGVSSVLAENGEGEDGPTVVYVGKLDEGEGAFIAAAGSQSGWADAGSAAGMDNLDAYTDMTVWLEGAVSGTEMRTSLKDNGYIPVTSPYADAATVTEVPDEVVDWIYLELRESETGPTVKEASAFVTTDGSVVNLTGERAVPFRYTG